tara:strand:- start:1003 stop:1125 length:123 start_codon:yes stop_codon:yes gene_type:complete
MIAIVKIMVIVFILLTTGCVKDYDFNPWTTTLRMIATHDN